jgi:hypothetical protein
MLRLGYDPEALILVAVAGSPPTPAADYEHIVQTITRMAEDAAKRGQVAVIVIVVGRDHDIPDAGWRRRIAEAEKRCQKLRMAMVSESTAARGVVTAIQWITGTRDTLTRSAHETLSDAIVAIEKDLGKSLPRIRELHDAARAELTAAGQRTVSKV